MENDNIALNMLNLSFNSMFILALLPHLYTVHNSREKFTIACANHFRDQERACTVVRATLSFDYSYLFQDIEIYAGFQAPCRHFQRDIK